MSSYLLMLIMLMVNSQDAAAAQGPDSIPDFLPKKLVALFKPGTYQVREKGWTGELHYHLFVPAIKSDVQRTFPLICFFHGHGPLEMDYPMGQLLYLDKMIFRDLDSPEKYPFFLLAVQCPRDKNDKGLRWIREYRSEHEEPREFEPAEEAMNILDAVCAEYPVDMDRIYLCGISFGGTTTWQLAVRYPDRFAAVVPLASTGVADNLETITKVPIWAFHSEGDKPIAVRDTVSKLHALGGICHLTEIPGKDHNCWFAAFQNYDLLKWMLAQRRTPEQNALLAKWHFFQYEYLRWVYLWPRLLSVAVVVAILSTCRAELRRQRRTKQMAKEVHCI